MNSTNDNLGIANLLAKYIRVKSLMMVSHANSSHIGSCLSVADLIAVVQILVQHKDGKMKQEVEMWRLGQKL